MPTDINEQQQVSVLYSKKPLHSKRSFHKHGTILAAVAALGESSAVDSPAYDASEEDNDPTTDDGEASAVPRRPVHPHLRNGTTTKKHQLANSTEEEDPGVDSPTYDGDVESTTNVNQSLSMPGAHAHYSSSEATASTLTSPASRPSALPADRSESYHSSFAPVNPSPLNHAQTLASESTFDPRTITAGEIQTWIQDVIAGAGSPLRRYQINQPPEGRPVVIYADGVYDLFHYGHALQLRQAKLSFPSVHLLVGVCSDDLVRKYKASTIMRHSERCESVRQCKWADEVIPEAPWILTTEFLEKYRIDYVAHDEDPYAALGHDDVYAPIKLQGKFLPTRRTPGISTSALLSRIVSQYRTGDFNAKLEQNGNEDLAWKQGMEEMSL